MNVSERYGQRVLGAPSTSEVRRLAAITQVSDNWTQQALREVGVASGWHCLEVGAGSGTVAEWLAEQVAQPGPYRPDSVLATDLDMRFL